MLDQFPDVDVPMTIVGETGVQLFDWNTTMEGLLLGQSAKALNLIGTKGESLTGKFAKVKDLQDTMTWQKHTALELSEGVEIRGRVKMLKKYNRNEILAVVELPNGTSVEILAGEVIAALGAGKERLLDVQTQKRYSSLERPFGEYITGSQAVSTGLAIESGCAVLVAGDGPTALWAAEVCMGYGAIPYVVGPNSGFAFSNANPGGRNSKTLKRLLENGLIYTGDIAGFEERDQFHDFSDMREAGIVTHFKNVTNLSSGAFRSTTALPVCRVVSAIGSMPSSMSLFDSYTVNDFGPIVVEGLEGRAAVGIATTDRDIMLVGAQAHSIGVGMGFKALFDAQGSRVEQPGPGIVTNRANVRAMLRERGRVKLGAQASEMDTIQALFIHDELDVMTANQAELSHFLQISAGVPKLAAGEIAAKVIEERKRYFRENRDFTPLDFVEELRKMEVRM
ncbi:MULTISPECIES: hypothetical protein [Paraburkholderia]|nr:MULTISPECIES: hypothetical protein [Paraburkholderia]